MSIIININSIIMQQNDEQEQKISSPRELALAIKKNQIVVMKISASWCGPCKNKNFLESYHNLKYQYVSNPKIKFIEFDIDEDVDILEDKQYYDIDIGSVPTFLLSKNGRFIKKYIGGGYLNEMNEFIQEVISYN